MQWLFKGSDEAPELTGLGIFPGRCAKIPDGVKVPHVGWNTLEITNPRSRLLADVAPGAYAYFTHSFAAPVVEGVVAAATYGGRFAAAAERRRVYGVQFHPEKSGRTGLQILENFVRLARDAH
jgi:glutamine amidotransferase